MLKRSEIKILLILHKLSLFCSTVAKEIIQIIRLNWTLCDWWLYLPVMAESEIWLPWDLHINNSSEPLVQSHLSLACLKGSRAQWGSLSHAELSGTRGASGWRSTVSYPGMGRQQICTVIRLEKLQLCPTWLWLPKSESGAINDLVSGLSYRGHCKPTSETTATVFRNTVTLTLSAGWRLFVYEQCLYLVPVCTVTNQNVMYAS